MKICTLVITMIYIVTCPLMGCREDHPGTPSRPPRTKKQQVISEKQQSLNDRLVDSAAKGRIEDVIEALDDGADINGFNYKDSTALMETADYGHINIARLLIEKGADIKTKNKDNLDALRLATYKDRPEFMKLLIKNGETVDTLSPRNHVLLISATENHSFTSLKILINNGLPINGFYQDGFKYDGITAAHGAVNSCNIEILKFLIREKIPIDIREKKEWETPLLSAAVGNCTEALMLLINAGANVNHFDIRGETALIHAARQANVAEVKYLLEHGANPNHKDKRQETALQHAELFMNSSPGQKSEYKEIISLLKKHMKKTEK